MSDEKIIAEARKRFAQAEEAFAEDRRLMEADLEFSDPTGPKQWPDSVRRERESGIDGARPCMTFDRTNQFVQQVVNDARQNKASIKLLPADSVSDPRLAQVLQGLVRQIEYASRASVAYDTALESAARIGLGYIRVFPEVEDAATNRQRIRIKRVVNPFSVLLDPDAIEPDGSDAMWGFVYEDIRVEEFDRLYPSTNRTSWQADGGWTTKDTVRVAEYFRVVETDAGRTCEWYKLTGDEVIERSEFPAEWPGIVPVIGAESWRDGKRRLAGLVRRVIDPQRSYNYERSSYIERVALAPKAPFVAAAEAVEGYEEQWARANKANAAYLPWNARDSEGEALPKPERTQPAPMEAGWQGAAQQSLSDMQAAFGMYEANLGAPSTEKSGRAILARQREGDTATYHYVDNLSLSIAQVGRIILQMIPRLYDAQRVVRVLGEDDQSQFVEVNPIAEVGYAEHPGPDGNPRIVINPSVGRYDVTVTMGPGYTTRRQESAQAISELVNGNPQIMAVLGDEWVRRRDWPGADKLAERFKALLPPELKGDDPRIVQLQQQAQQQMQALQQQAEQMMQQMQDALEQSQGQVRELQTQIESERADWQTKLAEGELRRREIELKEREVDVKAFDAETKRLQVLAPETPNVPALQEQTVEQALAEPDPDGSEPVPDREQMLVQAIGGILDRLESMGRGGRQYQFHYDDDGNVIGASEAPSAIQ